MTHQNTEIIQSIFDRLCTTSRLHASCIAQSFEKRTVDDGYELGMSDSEDTSIDIAHTWGTCYSGVKFETFDIRITVKGVHSGILSFDPDSSTNWEEVGDECFQLLQSLFATSDAAAIAEIEAQAQMEETRRTEREIGYGFAREHKSAWGMN